MLGSGNDDIDGAVVTAGTLQLDDDHDGDAV